jgi:D-alanyl-D-alanine carboxypeptidase (penicillin-binding protein 5/6)
MLNARTTLFTAVVCTLFMLLAGTPQAMEPEPPFNIASKAAVLMNPQSGQIICAKNPDTRIPPASLTKIMTLVVAYDEIDNGYASLDDQVKISEKAWRTGGSKMFVAVNSTVPLRQLLEGIAVVSGNDACVAVAEHIAGVEDVFVEKMNRKASEIGMRDTVFKNSHGLPDGQLTTARDMALLACYYTNKHPETLQMHSMKEMTYNSITQKNRNGLLWLDSSFDGLKTGWFSKAGYHIVATAHQDQDRFIAVVMGAKSSRQREAIARQLINYGFKNFATIEVLKLQEELAQTSVLMGKQDHVALGATHSLTLTLPRHELDDVVIQKDFVANTTAPVSPGQELGTVRVVMQDRELASVPLVALEKIDRAGLIKRIVHTVKLSFIQPPYWGALLLALLLIAVCIVKLAARQKKNKTSGYRTQKRKDDFL